MHNPRRFRLSYCCFRRLCLNGNSSRPEFKNGIAATRSRNVELALVTFSVNAGAAAVFLVALVESGFGRLPLQNPAEQMPIQGQTAIAVAPFTDNVGLEATPGRSPLILLAIAFLTLDGIAIDPLLQNPQLPPDGLPSVSRHDPAVVVAHDNDGRHPRCPQETEQGRTLRVMEGKVVKPGIQQHRARHSPPAVRRNRSVVDAGGSDRGIRVRKNIIRRGVIRDANHSIIPVVFLPSGQRVSEPMAHPGDGVHALTIGRIDEEEQGEGGLSNDERPPRRRC